MKKCEPPRLALRYHAGDQGSYVVPAGDSSSIYVGDWCIDADVLYHRHPDEISHDMTGATGVREYDVNMRVCWKCESRCPDSIWFAHRLQQLP